MRPLTKGSRDFIHTRMRQSRPVKARTPGVIKKKKAKSPSLTEPQKKGVFQTKKKRGKKTGNAIKRYGEQDRCR